MLVSFSFSNICLYRDYIGSLIIVIMLEQNKDLSPIGSDIMDDFYTKDKCDRQIE